MSILAGWQRGGWTTERLVWIATGVVLVAGAHLLPTLCRSAPLAVRSVGAVLWLGCMVAASYGHATFFLLSQSHAGMLREQSIQIGNTQSYRSLTAVVADQATVTAELAVAESRRCSGGCPSLQARRVSLAARRNALEVEAAEVRRLQSVADSNAARRAEAYDDPVAARLAALCAMAVPKLDLVAGLGFAAILEGVACLLWWIALLPMARHAPITTETDVDSRVGSGAEPQLPAEPETELDRLNRDIAAGLVPPTVSGIRKHLRCSQTRAVSLRRQLDDATT
ncbi:hypothetical protein [Caballeronia sp. GAWG2-1]|uniref:hypothetical protein n=1 Tax=Caballeronia sp. GAWG2-1 TaxID=2921744 RepID=UPI002027CF85|nr:hypothetical protein [Caballeronia sp. GAWG2-1]